jgi:hypothetical protein
LTLSKRRLRSLACKYCVGRGIECLPFRDENGKIRGVPCAACKGKNKTCERAKAVVDALSKPRPLVSTATTKKALWEAVRKVEAEVEAAEAELRSYKADFHRLQERIIKANNGIMHEHHNAHKLSALFEVKLTVVWDLEEQAENTHETVLEHDKEILEKFRRNSEALEKMLADIEAEEKQARRDEDEVEEAMKMKDTSSEEDSSSGDEE